MRQFATAFCFALACLALGFTLAGALPACDVPEPGMSVGPPLEQANCTRSCGGTCCDGADQLCCNQYVGGEWVPYCTDKKTDNANCGHCGANCGINTCTNGSCGTCGGATMLSYETCCNNSMGVPTVYNASADTHHCGGCNTAPAGCCAGGEVSVSTAAWCETKGVNCNTSVAHNCPGTTGC